MAYQPVPPPPPIRPRGGPGGRQVPPGTEPSPSAPRRPGWVKPMLVVALVVLAVVAGCTTLVYVGGSRLVGVFREPVDTANAFLDAARADEAAVHEYACSPFFELARQLPRSAGQHLTDVHIANDRATVSGTVTLQGGRVSPLTVELRQTDGEWCVDSTRFATPPG